MAAAFLLDAVLWPLSGAAVAAAPTAVAAERAADAAAAGALTSAVAALRAPGAPAMEMGEAWFLQQLAAQRADPELRALVAETERRLRDHRFARLLRADAPPPPLPADPGRGITRLATYVFAPVGAPPERAAAFIADFTATPGTGYILTHQFLVLAWARSVGLPLPAATSGRAPGLLAAIAAEQRADARFSDLFAERAAILLAFAPPSPAEADRWVEVIAAARRPDGRWLSPPSEIEYDGVSATANHPWTHTTGFVAAAMGFYLQQRGRSLTPLP
ncbi:hypothetical protein KF840_12065 [bacterium]|nr:hypothetical protein [bacterium]